MKLSPLADAIADDICGYLYDAGVDRDEFALALFEVATYYSTWQDAEAFKCLDCEVPTDEIHEYYMVHNEVWLEAHPDKDGMLCIGCLEQRLGRQLTAEDFTSALVNDPEYHLLSQRVLDRLNSSQKQG